MGLELFSKFIKPLATMLLAIFLPLAMFSFVSNLPASDPEIPVFAKELGYSAVNGEALEALIAKDPQFSLASKQFLIACPTVTLLSESEPALCGYCKFEHAVVYPFWVEGYTRKLKKAPYDYRHLYEDHLHRRFVLFTHSESNLFTQSERRSEWRESYGKWFMCQNEDLLDMNAYIEVLRDQSSTNKLKVSYRVLGYEPLEVVRDQIRLPDAEATKP